MGKIVKYCSSCDEDYAEKFGFCPTCGATLESFEMTPVAAQVEAAPAVVEPVAPAAVAADISDEVSVAESIDDAPAALSAEPAVAEPVIEPVAETIPVIAPEPPAPVFLSKPVDADAVRRPAVVSADERGAFNVTVIESKNLGTLFALLVGSFILVIAVTGIGVLKNLWDHSLDIGSINDELYNASLIDVDPLETEKEDKKADKDDAGGGGGGGDKNKEDVTKGDLANQTKNPERPPSVVPRFENPLPLPPASTEGNKKFDQKYDRFGVPNAQYVSDSNGTGSGGGQGNGRGTGQGNGNGTGAGNGNGSGFGNGNGDGNGDGSGSGNDGPGVPPPVVRGVSSPLRILAKTKPSYTDAARQNQVQGSVILRVTFLASGAIGSISTVKGLPYGLTEQAIAAARAMRFEPAKVNGVPQNVTRQVDFSFAIY